MVHDAFAGVEKFHADWTMDSIYIHVYWVSNFMLLEYVELELLSLDVGFVVLLSFI